MGKIEGLGKDELQEAPSTPDIVRNLAFRGKGCVTIRSRVAPGAVSGWHHHGEYHVFGYLASGTLRFESGPGGGDITIVNEGGFFHVPPHAIHRDVNPSHTEGQEVILFLQGQGDMVVNVEGPEPL